LCLWELAVAGGLLVPMIDDDVSIDELRATGQLSPASLRTHV